MSKKALISRREFISILASLPAIYPLSSLAKKQANTASSEPDSKYIAQYIKEPWLTLSEVQQHLFPQEKDAIGAKDIQALEYLHTTMNNPDFGNDEKERIQQGVTWLNDLSKQQYSKKFIQLDNDSKEKILRRIEGSGAGERWLSTLLTYLLEALLTDPVYGGNPNGVGWKWLQHQPGFPRPPENKKYFKLDPKRYRNTKA